MAIFRLFQPPRDSLQLFPLFRPLTLARGWPLLEPRELSSRRGVGHPFCWCWQNEVTEDKGKREWANGLYLSCLYWLLAVFLDSFSSLRKFEEFGSTCTAN